MPNLIGHSLGRYHILEQVGEGGMATIYKAYDTRIERDVAVKVLRIEQFAPVALERIRKRFEREARALAKLNHPNIVKIHEFGEHDGQPFLVMEYLPSGNLKKRLGRPLPWQQAVRLLLPIAEALQYAHEHGIIHRDVKPSNILLNEKNQPLLTDFGIAKVLDVKEGHTITATGVGIGTPEYMSPEQGLGKVVDERSDVYSLGIVFYELLTGRKPFTADTPMAVVVKHLNDPLPRPSRFAPGLPESVEKVLIKALAKQPENRFKSMGKFAAALEGLLPPVTPPAAQRKELFPPWKKGAVKVPPIFPQPTPPSVEKTDEQSVATIEEADSQETRLKEAALVEQARLHQQEEENRNQEEEQKLRHKEEQIRLAEQKRKLEEQQLQQRDLQRQQAKRQHQQLSEQRRQAAIQKWQELLRSRALWISITSIIFFIGIGLLINIFAPRVSSFLASRSPTQTAIATPNVSMNIPTPRPSANIFVTGTASHTATVTALPSTPTPTTYIVIAGDTLMSIALRYGVSVEALLAANPDLPQSGHSVMLVVGETLIIPVGSETPFVSTASRTPIPQTDVTITSVSQTGVTPIQPVITGDTTLTVPSLGRTYNGSVTNKGPYDILFVGSNSMGDWPHCSGSINQIEIRSLDGSRLLLTENFSNPSAFSQIGDTVYISNGKAVFDHVYMSGGPQFVYRTIPSIAEPIQLKVIGQIDWWENNCGVWAGIGIEQILQQNHEVDSPAIFFGYFGGGCSIQGPIILSPKISNFTSDGCSFTRNGAAWVDASTPVEADLEVK